MEDQARREGTGKKLVSEVMRVLTQMLKAAIAAPGGGAPILGRAKRNLRANVDAATQQRGAKGVEHLDLGVATGRNGCERGGQPAGINLASVIPIQHVERLPQLLLHLPPTPPSPH